MTTNQSAAPREVVEAQGAISAYHKRVGRKSVVDERNALHDALSATMKRLGKDTIDVEVAEAMAAEYRTDDNWGLLALVCLERMSGEAALDDLKRQKEGVAQRKPSQRGQRPH
jgi:hypothetical protein